MPNKIKKGKSQKYNSKQKRKNKKKKSKKEDNNIHIKDYNTDNNEIEEENYLSTEIEKKLFESYYENYIIYTSSEEDNIEVNKNCKYLNNKNIHNNTNKLYNDSINNNLDNYKSKLYNNNK